MRGLVGAQGGAKLRHRRGNALDGAGVRIGSVVRARSGAVLYRQGSIHQSESDGNGVSLATYIHAIFSLLIG